MAIVTLCPKFKLLGLTLKCFQEIFFNLAEIIFPFCSHKLRRFTNQLVFICISILF